VDSSCVLTSESVLTRLRLLSVHTLIVTFVVDHRGSEMVHSGPACDVSQLDGMCNCGG
jgi:hypothetical protein